jgi:hypothetical protein
MTSQLPTQFTPEALAAAFNGVPIFNGDINFIMNAMAELIRVRQPAQGDTQALEAIADDAITLSNAIYSRLEQQFGQPEPIKNAARGGVSLEEMEART